MGDIPNLTDNRSRLRLKRPADIAWAFVLGPTAGLTALFVLMLISVMVGPSPGLQHAARLSVALLIFGGLVCLLVELVVITPLLVGFRDRWRWLNGWSSALVGFALSFAPGLLLLSLLPKPSEVRPEAAAWPMTIFAATVVGVIGLMAAGVFRLLAVRTAAPGEP